MTDYNRLIAELGEFSDDAHNDNGQSVTPGRAVVGIAPSSIVVGVSTAIQVNGTGFQDDSDVYVNGSAVPTTYVSATVIRGTVTGSVPGSLTVTVGGASGSAPLTVTAAQGTAQGAATGPVGTAD